MDKERLQKITDIELINKLKGMVHLQGECLAQMKKFPEDLMKEIYQIEDEVFKRMGTKYPPNSQS